MNAKRGIACIAMLIAFTACSKKPDAMAVCKKLEAAGVAEDCKEDKPGGLGAAASERVEFELVDHDEGGQVMRFTDADSYKSTVKAFGAAAVLVGRHRYGSEGALIFVQLNSGATKEHGEKTKTLVDGL